MTVYLFVGRITQILLVRSLCLFIYLGFYVTFKTVQVIITTGSTQGQRKPVQTVGPGSVL